MDAPRTLLLPYEVMRKAEFIPDLLGDVIICIPKARTAGEYHSLNKALYLAVHGILHLLGYDHQTAGVSNAGGGRTVFDYSRMVPAPWIKGQATGI